MSTTKKIHKYYAALSTPSYHPQGPTLLIRVGDHATQVLVVSEEGVIGRCIIPIGTTTILELFPSIAEPVSETPLDVVVACAMKRVQPLGQSIRVAAYSADSLSQLQRIGYTMQERVQPQNFVYPRGMTLADFIEGNDDLFHHMTLDTVASLIPEDMPWVRSIRGRVALVQALCQKYGVQTIVPADPKATRMIHDSGNL